MSSASDSASPAHVRWSAYGGGVLIRSGDTVIGAWGVPGAALSQTDHEIAVAAIDQLD
ncbi:MULTISPECIES: heme-binding protein [unclassified Nocardia]|uniref:heme-binding protein n=1 Tax=unclassified Nocardia TaxID=2637762 RepID=UPI003436CFDB